MGTSTASALASLKHHSSPIVACVPLILISGDANHGQIRRLLSTLLETGSDFLETPSTREEAMNCAVGPSQLGGTNPEVGPQPEYNLQTGQAVHTVVPVYRFLRHHRLRFTAANLPLIFGFAVRCGWPI